LVIKNLNFDRNEISELKWMDLKEIKINFAKNPENFVQSFGNFLKYFLKFFAKIRNKL